MLKDVAGGPPLRESPELLERLQPVLEKFGTALNVKVSAGNR
jgi:hypothetical protein